VDSYALLDLAALVCIPTQPHCAACPIVDECAYAAARRTGRGMAC
jgi:adenine-specific DNA glycosylase